MTTPDLRRRSRPPLLVLLTTLLIVASGLVLPSVATAAPTQGTVSGATLSWGIKASFRSYVTGPIAHGSASLLGTTTGTYVWSGGTGDAAADGSTADVSFGVGNGVHFRGHAMNGVDALDLAFTNPRVQVTSASTADLYLDVHGREFAGTTTVGEEFSLSGVHFATVALPSATVESGTITWANASATLTEAGAQAFGGFYPAGTALDPLTLTLPVSVPAAATTTSLATSASNVKSGESVTLTATVAPAEAAGTVTFSTDAGALADPVVVENGAAVLATDKLPEGVNAITASFTPTDAASYLPSSQVATVTVETAAPEPEPEPEWEPKIQVFLADGVTPVGDRAVYAGDTLVVKGSGFDPAANVGGRGVPIPNTLPQGTYAVFGHFAQDWRPSQDKPSSGRKVGSQGWVLTEGTVEQIPPAFQDAVREQWVPLSSEGEFTWTVKLAAPSETVDGGRYGVYTYGAGGVKNADQELAVPLNYHGKRPPAVAVTDGEDTVSIAKPGDTVRFAASALEPGQSVRFEVHSDPVVVGTVTADDSGAAEVEWTVPENFPTGQHEVRVFSADAGVDAEPLARQSFTVQATAAPVDRCLQLGAELRWGVKASFRQYVAGPIAHGSISLLGSTGQSPDGRFVWSGGAGKADTAGGGVDVAFGTGNGVRFRGHRMGDVDALDLAFTNPRVVVTSATTAQLRLDVKGREFAGTDSAGSPFERSNVHFADLTLPGPSVSGATRTWTDAAAKLTADGAAAFGGFYEPGTELDPVTVSVTSRGEVDCDDITGPTTGSGETPTSPNGGTSTTGGGQIVPAAAAAAGGSAEKCVARRVTGGKLTWGVKESFRTYLQGTIAKGSYSGGTFTAAGGAVNPDASGIGRANFSGAFTATGHGGKLNFSLSSPSVHITGPTTAVLHAHVKATNTKGESAVDGTVAFANLSFGRAAVEGDTLSVSGASATLTGSGAQAFAGFYEPGTALDPVSFTVSLGSEVPCDSSTDPKAASKLPKTGADVDPSAAALALVTLLAGAAVLARRRQVLARH
ncbi:LPXTG cell wall anchor domain-containing protein [Aeromicrobium camelliae]|uniref:LPXTG cell wall anchor domain-containing protein n=1 Tax=Aeromicrobium camelliae TaxID=1538144 RepID=A0A3N6WQG5_9ACTN|nr:HtaA domain-containing protein [Aeromicrobium camelliae]RQN09689.1 LPXTG cell wall anchor domain-containing protein [Aeromicrobium camelliae]